MRRLLFLYAVIVVVCRGGSLCLELFYPNSTMPGYVLICNGVLLVLGALMVGMAFVDKLRTRHLQLFFVLEAGLTLFNLFYLSLYEILDMRWYENAMIGSILSLLLDVILLIFSLRRKRYIRIKSDFHTPQE